MKLTFVCYDFITSCGCFGVVIAPFENEIWGIFAWDLGQIRLWFGSYLIEIWVKLEDDLVQTSGLDGDMSW